MKNSRLTFSQLQFLFFVAQCFQLWIFFLLSNSCGGLQKMVLHFLGSNQFSAQKKKTLHLRKIVNVSQKMLTCSDGTLTLLETIFILPQDCIFHNFCAKLIWTVKNLFLQSHLRGRNTSNHWKCLARTNNWTRNFLMKTEIFSFHFLQKMKLLWKTKFCKENVEKIPFYHYILMNHFLQKKEIVFKEEQFSITPS